MLLGVGGTIGTGIFVLTSEAVQKAGPGMLISFLLVGTVCAIAALCYAELAAILVAIKLSALCLFIALALPAVHWGNFLPFAPQGWKGGHGSGILGAAASIFFANVGFDAVSTAAEETVNPQRNVPLGIIGGLAICTLFYLTVAAGVVGSPLGAQPLLTLAGSWLAPGSFELSRRCADFLQGTLPLPCSNDGLLT